MSEKSPQTYCRIMDYLDATDPEFANLLRGTCADMSLNLGRKAGVTLLKPVKGAFREEIEKLAYSDKPADASKACNILNTLILKDIFTRPNDFAAADRPIPTSQYPSQQLDVSAKGSTVSVQGATIKLDEKFEKTKQSEYLAVWDLTGKVEPPSGKNVDMKRVPKRGDKKVGKKGGYFPTQDQSRKLRFQIALAVENKYAAGMIGDAAATKAQDPFVKYSASLMKHLVDSGEEDLVKKFLPELSRCKLDFYILLEPHSVSYEIPDNIIESWWNNGRPKLADCGINKFYDDLLKKYPSAEIEDIEGKREAVLNQLQAQPRNAVQAVSEMYKEVYGAGAARKTRLDDLRFMSFMAFHQLEADPMFDVGKLNEILNMIGEAMHSDEPVLLNESALKYAFNTEQRVRQIRNFVNSTMFLYQHQCSDHVMRLPEATMDIYGDSDKLINYSAITYQRHHRAVGQSKEELIANIDILQDLSEEAKNKIKELLK